MMMTDNERMHRLLSTTSSKWSAIYRERLRLFGNVQGAFVFPEEFLNRTFYKGEANVHNTVVEMYIRTLEDSSCYIPSGPKGWHPISHIDDLLEGECLDHDILVGSVYFTSDMGLFATRKDAGAWLVGEITE